jgi:hypothetical protein
MSSINKISISVILILGVLLWLYIEKNVTLKSDNVRLQSNYEIVQKRSNRAQELTELEFKEFYRRYDSIALLLKIKTKNIQNIIVTQYRYKDTTVIKAKTVLDTIRHHIAFDVSEPNGCYSLSGFVGSDSSVWIDGVHINDELSVFVYNQKNKWFFGLLNRFWEKPFTCAKVFSACKNDTIKVIDDIKIINK